MFQYQTSATDSSKTAIISHDFLNRSASQADPDAAASASPSATTNHICTGARTLLNPGSKATTEYNPPGGPKAYQSACTTCARATQLRILSNPTIANGTTRIPA